MRQATRLVAGMAVCFALAACSNPQKARQEHFEAANKFMAAGKTKEAIVEYRNAIKADSKFGEARFKLAQAYESAGNVNQAFREYIRAADLMPANNEAQIKAATYLLIAGQFEDARTRIKPVVDRDPSNLEAQLVLGNTLVGLKDLDGAIHEIEDAIKIDPARGTSYSNLAAIKLAQGDKDQAKAAFEKAVQVDPRSVAARLALAYFQWMTKDLVAAEASLKEAVAIDPKHIGANRTMVAFYLSTNRAAQAEPYLKTLMSNGVVDASLQLAEIYMRARRTNDAIAVLEPLTKNAATQNLAETALAEIAYQTDKARANSLLDGVIKRNPADARALVLKGQWLAADGKLNEALERAQAAVKGDPKSLEAHFFLATLLDRRNQRKDAIAEYGEVLKLNPRATAAQLNLSRLNLLEGSPDSAVSFAESALSNSPENPLARAGLVRGLLGRRDIVRAEQELAPLLKQYPKVGLVHSLNATLHLLKKDLPGARAEYERALELAPNSVEALAGLTGLDLVQNKAADARSRVEKRLATEPNRPDLLMLAGQVYAAQRDYAKAETTLRTAIQRDPNNPRGYSMLAAVLLASGKLDAARAEFDDIAARDTTNVAASTMAAMIVHSQNKIDEAKKRYEAIVNAHPAGSPVAANNLAWIYAEEGQKLDDALRLAQGAASGLPDNPEIQDTLGWIYVKKELPALAIPAFEKSVEKAPDNASYHYHLALALSKSGDKERARAAAQQAVKLKPDYADAKDLLAQLQG